MGNHQAKPPCPFGNAAVRFSFLVPDWNERGFLLQPFTGSAEDEREVRTWCETAPPSPLVLPSMAPYAVVPNRHTVIQNEDGSGWRLVTVYSHPEDFTVRIVVVDVGAPVHPHPREWRPLLQSLCERVAAPPPPLPPREEDDDDDDVICEEDRQSTQQHQRRFSERYKTTMWNFRRTIAPRQLMHVEGKEEPVLPRDFPQPHFREKMTAHLRCRHRPQVRLGPTDADWTLLHRRYCQYQSMGSHHTRGQQHS